MRSQSHQAGRAKIMDSNSPPHICWISRAWFRYCSFMSQPSEVRGWAGEVLGSTYHSGTQLLSGGAVCLSAWSPMSQQEGKDGVHTWEIPYRSGLEGARIALAHIPLPHLEAGV